MLVFIPIRLIIRLIMSQFGSGGQKPQEQTVTLLHQDVHEEKERAILGDGFLDSAAPAHTPANVFLTDGTNLQSLSDGASNWRAERGLMRAWCITSVVALIFGGVVTPSAVSAVIGIICSVRYLCCVNQPTPAKDAAANVQVVYRLAIVTAVLSGFWMMCNLAVTIVIFAAPDYLDILDKGDKDDNSLPVGIILLGVLVTGASLLAHTVTSSMVAHRAKMIKRQMSACSILV